MVTEKDYRLIDGLPAPVDELPAHGDDLPAHGDDLPAHRDELPAHRDELVAHEEKHMFSQYFCIMVSETGLVPLTRFTCRMNGCNGRVPRSPHACGKRGEYGFISPHLGHENATKQKKT